MPMELVRDEIRIQQEISSHIQQKHWTNFLISQEAFKQAISKEQIQIKRFEGGLYLFWEYDTQIKLYCFLEKDIKEVLCLPEFEKPLILEYVALKGKEQKPFSWEQMGLSFYKERSRYHLLTKKIDWNEHDVGDERDVLYASLDLAEEILNLMHTSFEPYASLLPDLKELEEDILNERVIVRMQDGNLCGFLRFSVEKQVLKFMQIVVLEFAQGQKVGTNLIIDCFYEMKEQIKKYILWVDEENLSAMHLYTKMGFLPDGRIIKVFKK